MSNIHSQIMNSLIELHTTLKKAHSATTEEIQYCYNVGGELEFDIKLISSAPDRKLQTDIIPDGGKYIIDPLPF